MLILNYLSTDNVLIRLEPRLNFPFISQQLFDDHVFAVHSIDQEGLEQLQSMMKALAEKEGDFPDAPRATKGT